MAIFRKQMKQLHLFLILALPAVSPKFKNNGLLTMKKSVKKQRTSGEHPEEGKEPNLHQISLRQLIKILRSFQNKKILMI